MKTAIAFALFNAGVIAAVFLILFAPVMNSLRNNREIIQISERRIAAEHRLYASFECNLQQLNELHQTRKIPSYTEIIYTLAETTILSERFGLRTTEFSSAEVSTAGTATYSRLFEKRVRAEYEGGLYGLVNFMYNLENVYVRSFSLETAGRLSLEFSIFGSGR